MKRVEEAHRKRAKTYIDSMLDVSRKHGVEARALQAKRLSAARKRSGKTQLPIHDESAPAAFDAYRG